MDIKLDLATIKLYGPIALLAVYFIRNFINNLLTNCPFLQANKIMEVIQGIFNALVQTVTQSRVIPVGQPDNSKNDTAG